MENESFSVDGSSEPTIEDPIEEPAHPKTIPGEKEIFVSPRKRLCLKKKSGPGRDDAIISDALSIMKRITEKMKNASEKNECQHMASLLGKN